MEGGGDKVRVRGGGAERGDNARACWESEGEQEGGLRESKRGSNRQREVGEVGVIGKRSKGV